jgi:hypothetical protein
VLPGIGRDRLKHNAPDFQAEGCGSGLPLSHRTPRPSDAAAAAAATSTQHERHAHGGAVIQRDINMAISGRENNHQEKKQTWRDIPKSSPLPSYVAAAAIRRQQAQEEEVQKYAGDPPPETELIQVSSVFSTQVSERLPSDVARYS